MLERLTSPGSIDGPGVSSGSVEGSGLDGGSSVSAGGGRVGRGVGMPVSAATWVDGAGGDGMGVHAAATRAAANTAMSERPLFRLIAPIVTLE